MTTTAFVASTWPDMHDGELHRTSGVLGQCGLWSMGGGNRSINGPALLQSDVKTFVLAHHLLLRIKVQTNRRDT